MKVSRFGADAWSVEPGELPSAAIDRARVLAALAATLGDARDPVVGSRSVLVFGADPSQELVETQHTSQSEPGEHGQPIQHVIPVVYDGPDLEAVAAATGLSVEGVIELHGSVDYTAVLCGFLPGFAYLAETPPELRVPRRGAPRAKVTPRSVGIAGPYTGIYPSASPGGWNLLGEAVRSDLFDPARARPPLVNLLDRVRFERVTRAEAQLNDVLSPPAIEQPIGDAELTITRLSGLATLVDRGRHSYRRFGVPLGGALDRESYEELARTCSVDACIELVAGAIELTVTRGSTWLASHGEPAKLLREGESMRFAAQTSLTRLIALGGEPCIERVLGSRSSIVGFAWAGRLGRPFVKGDAIGITHTASMPASVPRAIEASESELTLDFQPAVELAGAFDGLRLEVGATSSRVGTRLHRQADAGMRAPPIGESHPTVPGVVQETPDGTLMVLGPDSATLGGYPVVGFLPEQARSALARLRPGRAVRLKV